VTIGMRYLAELVVRPGSNRRRPSAGSTIKGATVTYGFRVRFRLPPTSRFPQTMDDERLDLVSDLPGTSVWLKSSTPDVALKDADGAQLLGAGYESEADAEREGERWRDALQVSLARTGMGADFGHRSHPRSFISPETLAALEAEHGRPVLNDEPGVQVFRREPLPIFMSFSASGSKSPLEPMLVEALRIASATGPHHDEVETIAFDLYSASFFTTSADARMLMLMMALETLLTLEPRPEAAKRHVGELIKATKEAGLSADETASLVSSLKWLENESINHAGRRLVATLGDRTYMGLSPVAFFKKCYALRSDLAHGAVPRPDFLEVDKVAANLETMLSHLLSGGLLAAVPD
jgi:hypothetical protein